MPRNNYQASADALIKEEGAEVYLPESYTHDSIPDEVFPLCTPQSVPQWDTPALRASNLFPRKLQVLKSSLSACAGITAYQPFSMANLTKTEVHCHTFIGSSIACLRCFIHGHSSQKSGSKSKDLKEQQQELVKGPILRISSRQFPSISR